MRTYKHSQLRIEQIQKLKFQEYIIKSILFIILFMHTN